ncbi:alpha-L-arabinofuranosidase C-terminal domain-containing protein [Spirosoma areae]
MILKVANVSDKAQARTIQLDGVKKLAANGKLILLKNNALDAVNSFENATNVSPVEQRIPVDVRKKSLSLTVEPRSFSVIRVRVL